jgi:hypothetical protein
MRTRYDQAHPLLSNIETQICKKDCSFQIFVEGTDEDYYIFLLEETKKIVIRDGRNLGEMQISLMMLVCKQLSVIQKILAPLTKV